MNDWSLVYNEFKPEQEALREALCTLGNGYFASRGAAPESNADGVHYPGTYLAGGYNRLKTEIAGRMVENEDLVNLPNWLPFNFRVPGEAWFNLQEVEILDFYQELDLKSGILLRRLRFRDPPGRVTKLVQRRLAHMQHFHLAALETELTAENWSGTLEVRSALDGQVVNANVARYQQLNNRHLEFLESAVLDPEGIFLKVRTNQSHLQVALAARLRLFHHNECLPLETSVLSEEGHIAQFATITLQEGEPLRLEKVIALYTSRDRAISECALAARNAIRRALNFAELLASQVRLWEMLWERFDLELVHTDPDAGNHTAGILRLHIFHLLQTTSPNIVDLDVGVPARGLHGEAYRGHIFWDELFIFPFLNLRIPEITRALLMYRYRRLPAARRAAREAGYRGAMYPWQSGSDGREESQQLHLNPRSNRWISDNSGLQRHVNAAIAYNIWQYFQVTGDIEFLSFFGAEMMLEIARFWASIASYNATLDRYEILGVIGPDEYHEAYPDGQTPGLNNNAYSNLMAVWVLCRALELPRILPQQRFRELWRLLELHQQELNHWEEISHKMRVVFQDDGIISQFEGYEQLREFNWEGYRQKYSDIQRLDRLLEAEGDTPNRYKLSKQADVLMLFYLFSSEELRELFGRLGYDFHYETIPDNINYYLQRTSHGSTLSNVVHAWVLARLDRAGSWRFFSEALQSDITDVQGGTTPEGIHLGAMAGTVDLVQRAYSGIETRRDTLWLNPSLPTDIKELRMSIRYRGHSLHLHITQALVRIAARESTLEPINVGFREDVHRLAGGGRLEFTL
jgi:alpha,alpha-trehalase